MNLQQLYYFRTLAEIKNFTKASIKLMVTQPSLSHSINDLEAELGICLFNRGNRQVTLTKYGELFLEYVDRSLNILDEGRIKLNDFISPEQGNVSLHYVSSIDSFIPYLVAHYYERNEGLQTVFRFNQTTNILIQNALMAGNADVGLGMIYNDEPGLCTYRLGSHGLMLLVSASHPLAKQDSVDLRDVRGERFITYKQECTIRGLIDTIFQSWAVNPRIVSETVHDTVIYGAVGANLGVGLVPAPLCGEIYNVKALRIENDIPNHDVYLKWKNERYISPAVCQFRDFIIDNKDMFEEYRAERVKLLNNYR